MGRGRPRKIQEEIQEKIIEEIEQEEEREEENIPVIQVEKQDIETKIDESLTGKEQLLIRQKELYMLYERIKQEGIHSISDIEVKIANINKDLEKT